MQLIVKVITAYIEFTVRDNTSVSGQANKHLLLSRFTHHAIDHVALSRILNDPAVVSSIPAAYRRKVGRPQVAFKYDDPIGTRWVNARKVAHMSEQALHDIRSQPCGCHLIPEQYKVAGHLRTSDPSVLPGDGLPHICAMGAKYRPTHLTHVLDADTRQGIYEHLSAGVKTFANKAHVRAGNPRCMLEWQALVLDRIRQQLDSIPDGTRIQPAQALSYTAQHAASMRTFLSDKVCTTMDKAAGTMMFCCQQDYIRRIEEDLAASTVYSACSLSQQ